VVSAELAELFAEVVSELVEAVAAVMIAEVAVEVSGEVVAAAAQAAVVPSCFACWLCTAPEALPNRLCSLPFPPQFLYLYRHGRRIVQLLVSRNGCPLLIYQKGFVMTSAMEALILDERC
jgi:hypothetical protein